MRNPTRLCVALALAAGGLAALPAPARAEQKIAYVDLQRALNEIEEGKGAKASLKKEFDQKQKLLDDKKSEFEKLRGGFEKQAAVMTEQARKDKQGELEKKGMELQGYFVQLQKELSDRERELTRGIFEKMQVIVKEIADQDGIAAVVQAEALAYASPSLDLTGELVRKYNARHKGGGAPAKSGEKKSSKKESK